MQLSRTIMFGISLVTLSMSAVASHSSSGYNQTSNTVNFDIFNASNGWTMVEDDRNDYSAGGQNYDTEYLFMKYNDNDTLSIGLQSGFDLRDGKRGSIKGGDLALAFRDENGNLIGNRADTSKGGQTDYNYAIDFGFSYYDNGIVNDTADAGLYEVSEWINHTSNRSLYNNGVYTMETANSIGSLSQNDLDGASRNGYQSYYRIVTFDLNDINNLSDSFTVDAFWTMSCGNDQIYGDFDVARNTPVPEPSIIALMGIGSLAIFASGIRRKKAK